MPTARYGAATGVIGGKLHVASGCCVYNSFPYPRFTENETYDPVTNTWTTNAPIPLAVYGAATGVINGKLYLAGGAADELHGTNRADLQVYDPVTDSWTTEAPLPVAGVAAAAGVINGKLYVAGGVNPADTAAVNTVFVYDPATNVWTTLAPIPTARSGAAAAVVNGILYVIGGNLTDGTTCNLVEAYDPVANTWSTKASAPSVRFFAGAGVLNGIIYVVGGGVNGTGAVLATVEAYDPVLDTWTTLAPMPTPTLLPGSGVINDTIYAAGGVQNGGTQNLNVLQAGTPIAAQVQPPINANGSSVFKATRGVVPVQFALTVGGVATCTLSNATISLTRTAGGTIGSIDESVYVMSADSGPNFRVSGCQYIYNLGSKSLGSGTYRVDISISGGVVGSAIFGLQ
jgi:N-acetylneuraminic acid mutarotase